MRGRFPRVFGTPQCSGKAASRRVTPRFPSSNPSLSTCSCPSRSVPCRLRRPRPCGRGAARAGRAFATAVVFFAVFTVAVFFAVAVRAGAAFVLFLLPIEVVFAMCQWSHSALARGKENLYSVETFDPAAGLVTRARHHAQPREKFFAAQLRVLRQVRQHRRDSLRDVAFVYISQRALFGP